MNARLLGLALLGIAVAGFIVVVRQIGAAQPTQSAPWEMLLALFCAPAAVVGMPLVLFGRSLFTASLRPGGQGRSGGDTR